MKLMACPPKELAMSLVIVATNVKHYYNLMCFNLTLNTVHFTLLAYVALGYIVRLRIKIETKFALLCFIEYTCTLILHLLILIVGLFGNSLDLDFGVSYESKLFNFLGGLSNSKHVGIQSAFLPKVAKFEASNDEG